MFSSSEVKLCHVFPESLGHTALGLCMQEKEIFLAYENLTGMASTDLRISSQGESTNESAVGSKTEGATKYCQPVIMQSWPPPLSLGH
jgi:hypothetical protein